MGRQRRRTSDECRCTRLCSGSQSDWWRRRCPLPCSPVCKALMLMPSCVWASATAMMVRRGCVHQTDDADETGRWQSDTANPAKAKQTFKIDFKAFPCFKFYCTTPNHFFLKFAFVFSLSPDRCYSCGSPVARPCSPSDADRAERGGANSNEWRQSDPSPCDQHPTSRLTSPVRRCCHFQPVTRPTTRSAGA